MSNKWLLVRFDYRWPETDSAYRIFSRELWDSRMKLVPYDPLMPRRYTIIAESDEFDELEALLKLIEAANE
jgi:hypothetical protein